MMQKFPAITLPLRGKSLGWTLLAVGVLTLGLGGVGYYIQSRLNAAAAPMDFDRLEALTVLSDPQLQTKLIRTGPADYRYNCHGWTFTGGQREVDADELEMLLARDYQPTTKPQLGDIIVYRDHMGQAMHSGVVKAVGENGLVLIESKWGASGRFIHEPTISRTFRSSQYYSKIPDLVKNKNKPLEKKAEQDTVEATADDQ